MRLNVAFFAAVFVLMFVVGYRVVGVHAQGAPTLVAEVGHGFFAIDSSGRVFRKNSATWQIVGQLPNGTPVSLDDGGLCCTSGLTVGMANGDIFATSDPTLTAPLQFRYVGNVFGGSDPVRVERESISGVKGTYRK